jgi:hypothetical protein
MDSHDHPQQGAPTDRRLSMVEKLGFLIPDDAVFLPAHLCKTLAILLQLRRQEGNAEVISPTSTRCASLYGCSVGNFRRNLCELATAYPGITIENPSRTVRLIRFSFHVFNQDTRTPTFEKGARRRASKVVDSRQQGCAPGAPRIQPPVISSLKRINTTLRNDLNSPEIPEPVSQPVHNATPPPIQAPAIPTETAEARELRLAAHLASLTEAERKALESAVIKRSPSHRGRSAILNLLVLAELAQAHPDLYPPLVEPPPAPKPTAESAMTTVEKIHRLSSPVGPEAVASVVESVVKELADYHSVSWHRQLWQSAASGEIDPKTLAKLFTAAKRTDRPAMNFGRSVKGLRGLSEKTDEQALRQESLPIGPKTFPAPV